MAARKRRNRTNVRVVRGSSNSMLATGMVNNIRGIGSKAGRTATPANTIKYLVCL